MIAIIRNRKIKVLIRKITDGPIHFWSVIPDWKTSYHRDIKLISTMDGDLVTD